MAPVGNAKPAIAVAMFALLSACASAPGETSDDRLGRAFVAPGKYVLYTCKEIANQAAASAARAKQLEDLMAKAGTETSGEFVNAIAYRPEYIERRGELNELRNAAIAKNCNSAPGAPAPGGRTSDSAVR